MLETGMSTDLLAPLRRLSDTELVARLKDLAARERGATVLLIAHVAELDTRDVHLRAGHGSLFAYCREVLALSEQEAYNRIVVARSARRFPVVLEMLEAGVLNLTTVRLLAPRLTPDNHRQVLESARGKSKLQVEEIAARLWPRPDAPSLVRKLPAPKGAGSLDVAATAHSGAPSSGLAPVGTPAAVAAPDSSRILGAMPEGAAQAGADPVGPVGPVPTGAWPAGSGSLGPSPDASAFSRADAPGPQSPAGSTPEATPPTLPWSPARPFAEVTPLSPDRYRVQVTIGGETLEKLRLAKDLLRHALPSGDEAAILDRALTALLADLAQRKFAAAERPRPSAGVAPGSRHVPAEVKRAVWVRDLGRCAFVGTNGHRCVERGFLEFHHMRPYALGGLATIGNIQLRCRAHNDLEARVDFGRAREDHGRSGGHGDGGNGNGGHGFVREGATPYGGPALLRTSNAPGRQLVPERAGPDGGPRPRARGRPGCPGP